MWAVRWKRRSSDRPDDEAVAGPRCLQSVAPQDPVTEAEAPAPTDDGLSIEVIRGHSSVLYNKRSNLTVLFRLKVPSATVAEAQRPPVQVACVLDCSGSMGGSKMDFAKRGVMKLVKHLGPGDVLHFVTYASSANVLFRDGDLSPEGKQDLRAEIMGLRPEGPTNLHDGLKTAAGLLSENSSPHTKSCRRIFLLSDGFVNAGVTNSQEILASVRAWADHGIKTSTFGIGVDFDEPLMRGIASVSGGHYCYFSSVLTIPGLISKAVHNMLGIYATEARLHVTACDHARVLHLYGATDDTGDELGEASYARGAGSGKMAALHLGDLVHADRRWLMVSVEVLPKVAGPLPVLRWVLSARAPGGGPGPADVRAGTVEVDAVTDAAELAPEHASVSSVVSLQMAAELERQVTGLLASKSRKSAHHVKVQQATLLTKALENASSLCVPEVEMLTRALARVRVMEERFCTSASMEDLRRQAAEEHDKERSMSIMGWESGEDSSAFDDGKSQSGDSSPTSCRSSINSRDSSPARSISSSRGGARVLLHQASAGLANMPSGKAQHSQQGCTDSLLPELKAPLGPSTLIIPDLTVTSSTGSASGPEKRHSIVVSL